jgi:hypothetical protein
MRLHLELRSPTNGTGWQDTWTFTGADAAALDRCLDDLDAYLTDPAPTDGDRWRAAILLFPPEWYDAHVRWTPEPPPADRAWTAEAAPVLAALLPERLAGLREDLLARFGA